jgi:FkbH-like protein
VDQFRFAISATFTAEPIQPVLAFWGRQLNSEFQTRFAPFNQLLQTLLDPASEFAANRHGVNVVLARIEDFAGGSAEALDANIQHFADVLREAPAHMSVPIIVALCPDSPSFTGNSAQAAAKLAANLEDTPGAQLLAHEQIAHLYPVPQPHSPEGERLGGIPYTELYFCALGTSIVRHAHALFMPPYKVIALDCDNTLWQGICGEDGPDGIIIDPPRRALQQFMADQREDGMLLAMASKNNEQDVIETFEHHPAMPLQLRHFAGWRLNWEPKSANLTELADELSLGLDSFIFIDDNPKECAEVEGGIPEVLTLALPADPGEIPHFLEHVWAFDHSAVTEEDRNRNAYYAQAQEFGREMKRSADLESFMRSLDLRVTFEPLAAERLPRAAQLTQRTNQFNFTGIRRTESEIQALVASGHECVTASVSDRFGDYGLVGVMIYGVSADVLEIDTLLLSCRALGRGVEHRMMAYLGDLATKRSCSTVMAHLKTTARNEPARQFLHSIGERAEQPAEDGFVYTFDAAALRSLEWTPSAGTAAPKPPRRRRDVQPRRFVEFAAIAHTLSRPAEILEAMRAESRHEKIGSGMNGTEARLAAIWSDLLQKPEIAISDNFFDLGGHSLLAVLLIMRVREAFDVELPIDDVYSATLTLGELASKIELYQAGMLNASEYESLLQEIENLPDEEVARLLAEEDPGALRP